MNNLTLKLFFALMVIITPHALAQTSDSLIEAGECVVKLYGEGGVRGIEGYQSGLLVSLSDRMSAEGLILTVDSPTLGGGELVVVLANGDRYTARVQSTDPRSDLALLRIELDSNALPCFYLEGSQEFASLTGTTAYALSNCFNIASGDEPITRQRTTIASEKEMRLVKLNRLTRPQQVLLLDAVTSNPGAAGGALVDRDGKLIGMIGKESRSGLGGSWLNYALPTNRLYESFQLMVGTDGSLPQTVVELSSARRPGALYEQFGIVLVPQIGSRTPPLVEHISTNSLADSAGLLADDLLISIQGIPVGTTALAEQTLLSLTESKGVIPLVLLRNDELVVIQLGDK